MTSDLHAKWRALLLAGPTGMREVDGSHPFRRLYGSDDEGRPQFVMFTDLEPTRPPISAAVRVSVGRRQQDDRWTLALTLLDPLLCEVFLHLAVDLVRRTDDAEGPKDGLQLILLGLDEWRRVLNPPPPGHLTDEELRGLIAELWVADEVLSRDRSVKNVVSGWLGPFGNPQDFSFGSASYEVKSIRPHATRIQISSTAQLTVEAGSLELLVLTLADAQRGTDGAISLTMLVATVRAGAVSSGGMSSDVDTRLRLLGVDIGDPYYAERWFVPGPIEAFEVTANFPALRSDRVPLGVERVSYEITRSALIPFAVDANSDLHNLGRLDT